MITKAKYIARRGASLKALDREIVRLTLYANRATADEAGNYRIAIDILQGTCDRATKMLRELHANTDGAWVVEEATTDVENAWNELRNALFAAISTTYCDSSRSPSEERPKYGRPHDERE